MLQARCLDELDRAPEAVAALRAVLQRRNPVEARVRLARRLILSGSAEEGRALASEVVAEAPLVAPALRRAQAPWTRAARDLLRGRTALPKTSMQDGAAPLARWR